VVTSEEIRSLFELKTSTNVDVQVSSDFMEKEDEEEDLIRFEDIMNAASHIANTLKALNLSYNVIELSGDESFSFHLI